MQNNIKTADGVAVEVGTTIYGMSAQEPRLVTTDFFERLARTALRNGTLEVWYSTLEAAKAASDEADRVNFPAR